MEIFKSPTGNKLSCKGWQQEGLLRLLLNCLNPDIAKDPEELVAYGGTGKVARDLNSLKAIIEALKTLENDETLLIQSGKPVGIFRTFEFAPRVIMAGALLVPRWANWDYFQELSEKGLTAYGQSTAGSWSYIGTQGILQGTWETFFQVAKRHFGGSLRGKLVLTSGLGEMGSAQPIAITSNGGVAIVVDVDRAIVKKRLISSMIDIMASSLEEACEIAKEYISRAEPISIGVVGNAADAYEAVLSYNIKPDVVTDQTPAHDLKSYVPSDLSPEEARELGKTNPEMYEKIARDTIKRHVLAMIEFKKRGSVVFDYGNNLREQGHRVGVKDAFCFPGFASEYIRPLFCEGRGPFRWIALSGDPEDIYRTDEIILSIFKGDGRLKEWIDLVERRFAFHGLPARVCWLNYKERAVFGNIINEMVKLGELKAPVAITRDHMDAAAVASPFRETEAMKDGSDAVADWPVLNALLNCASGASLVGLYHGGGVGIGYSIHSGVTVIADGSREAQKRLDLVLKADPALGVIRYADAGYEIAKDIIKSAVFPAKAVE
ncbi:urocanate hydratase [Thermosediminibacter litoriperuensis]|uniref:Urocanate hydratase n=1 Tax=Thermosediminibacter litoriperuensis TaxID=291989 RepID=A0A5S5AKB2_9FIRM|nr:urocanate hydratase [Thermosediminibacter litoriperuensis]TYP51601.1 urocanate hydratase [Thermosediminibacter litoriperuensis]